MALNDVIEMLSLDSLTYIYMSITNRTYGHGQLCNGLWLHFVPRVNLFHKIRYQGRFKMQVL